MTSTIVHDLVTAQPGLSHVDVGGDYYLLKKLVRNIGIDRPRKPRWVHVMDCLGHGSGVAQAICDALGLDPDEEVGSDPEPELEDEDAEFENDALIGPTPPDFSTVDPLIQDVCDLTECDRELACITEGTLVVIGDGIAKPVEDVVDGDTVQTTISQFQRALGRVTRYTERYNKPEERDIPGFVHLPPSTMTETEHMVANQP